MANTKIMVNFTTKKVVHTEHHAGSKEYKHLISRGYEQVGTAKAEYTDPDTEPNLKIYWDADYFEPKDKYVRDIPSIPGL